LFYVLKCILLWWASRALVVCLWRMHAQRQCFDLLWVTPPGWQTSKGLFRLAAFYPWTNTVLPSRFDRNFCRGAMCLFVSSGAELTPERAKHLRCTVPCPALVRCLCFTNRVVYHSLFISKWTVLIWRKLLVMFVFFSKDGSFLREDCHWQFLDQYTCEYCPLLGLYRIVSQVIVVDCAKRSLEGGFHSLGWIHPKQLPSSSCDRYGQSLPFWRSLPTGPRLASWDILTVNCRAHFCRLQNALAENALRYCPNSCSVFGVGGSKLGCLFCS